MSWKTLSTKLIEANPHLRFFVDEFETEEGKKGKYWYHMNAYGDDAVCMFVRKDENTFIMTREYRYLFDRIAISNPKGSIDEGETPEQAARREIVEECGYEPTELVYLGWLAPALAFSKEKMHLFLATSVKKIGQHLDKVEQIEVIEMTKEQINEAIRSGEIWDGQVVMAWYKVKDYLGL